MAACSLRLRWIKTRFGWLSANCRLCLTRDVRTINEHIRNVLAEQELAVEATIRKFRIVQQEGERKVNREIEHYNLIWSFPRRLPRQSKKGTQFRIRASRVLKQFLVQESCAEWAETSGTTTKLADLKQAIALSSTCSSSKTWPPPNRKASCRSWKYSHALTVLDDYDHQRLPCWLPRAESKPEEKDTMVKSHHQFDQWQ